jgi:hypothetical protein
MRRIAAAAAALFLATAVSAAAADLPEIPFVPLSPLVMGRGGSFIADTRGYDSFFFNPAGFSRDGGSFTLTSASSWIYSRVDDLVALGGQLLSGTATASSELAFMNKQVTTGGLGAGAQWGIGYVGNGLGLGAMVIVDSLLSGPTLLGMSGDITGTIGFIGGLSYPFQLGGVRFHVGGAVRPMIRIHVPLDNSSSIALLGAVANGQNATAALSSANALYGVGIGLDLGTIAEVGWFTFGLSIRDLAGTQFRYAASTFGTVSSTFGSQMRFPAGTPVSADTYTIPMDMAFGIGFHPDFGNFNGVFDPSMSVDVNDLVSLFTGARTVWTLLHAGAQVRILSVFSVSAGLNQGYLTAGFGVKLFFLDINAALFTRELGVRAGDKPNAGAALDVSIRW